MAKPKKKAAKVQSGMLAALYGLDAGTERGDAVRAVLAKAGVRVRTVGASQLNDPVGYIVGMPAFRPSPAPFAGEAPAGEFMLLSNVGSKALSSLLAAMRDAEASVELKALVTVHNRPWRFVDLMTQVAAEHAELSAR